jgi:hypothetical protein
VNNEILPVVAYIRESTGRQSMYGYKPEVQKKEIGKYCKRLSSEIVQMFEDSGSGGDIEKRPKFQEMIRYVKARGIRFIVIAEISRFFRNFEETVAFERDLREKFGIFAIDTECDWEPREYLTKGIPPHVRRQRMNARMGADDYLQNLKRDISDGYKEKKDSGQYVGPLPFGLEWMDDQCKFVRYKEDEKEIVKEIFEKYASGKYSVTTLMHYLNDKGYRCSEVQKIAKKRKSGAEYEESHIVRIKFTYDRVLGLLKNKSFMGLQNTGIKNLQTLDENGDEKNIEPLVDPDGLFTDVQSMLQNKHHGGKVPNKKNSRQAATNRVYLFQNIIRHAPCGGKMHGTPEKTRTGGVERRYQCSKAKYGECKARPYSFRAEEIEKSIIELMQGLCIKDTVKIEEELRQIIKLTAKEFQKPDKLSALSEKERKELQRIQEALDEGWNWGLEKLQNRLLELKIKASTRTERAVKYYDFTEIREVLGNLSKSFQELQDLAGQERLLKILFKDVFAGKLGPEKPHKFAGALHWMPDPNEDYDDFQKAKKLRGLLQVFTPMFFEEIQTMEELGTSDSPVKRITFKPTGIFLLIVDQTSTKKKS